MYTFCGLFDLYSLLLFSTFPFVRLVLTFPLPFFFLKSLVIRAMQMQGFLMGVLR